MVAPLRARLLTSAIVAALLLAGCAKYQEAEVADPSASQNRQRDVITHEEIMASPQRLVDLYQAVRGLRPHFLLPNTSTRNRAYPTSVYIDGVRQQNGLQTLTSIPAESVERVEYLDPGRAESQLGSTAAGGAVMITLSGQRRGPSGE